MKTFYAATTTFDDRGRVTANITDARQANEKPENTYTETTKKDIYVDWYETKEEAQTAIQEACSA